MRYGTKNASDLFLTTSHEERCVLKSNQQFYERILLTELSMRIIAKVIPQCHHKGVNLGFILAMGEFDSLYFKLTTMYLVVLS